LFDCALSTDNEGNQNRNATMTSNRPDSLTVPSLEAYPFIDALHFHHNVSFKHNVLQQDLIPSSKQDEEFQTLYFDCPAYISDPQVAAVQALSDETFTQLFKILEVRTFGVNIETRQDLERVAAANLGRFNAEDDPFTIDQLQTYILAGALTTNDIHWAKLAELYNASEPDQKEAIHQYFLQCQNRNLSDLMDTPALEIALPESLQETFQSKEMDGQTFLFNETKQQWVREDIFSRQFTVSGFHRSTKTHSILASAPTLRQAIAKATVYTEKARGGMASDLVVLREQGKYLAQGEMKMRDKHEDDCDIMELLVAPQKLKWNFEQLGQDLGHLKIKEEKLREEIRRCHDENTVSQLKEQINEIELKLDRTVEVSEVEFTKLVFAVEKILGLQWNRVSRLEDALGL
jgi:hypothetical protein